MSKTKEADTCRHEPEIDPDLAVYDVQDLIFKLTPIRRQPITVSCLTNWRKLIGLNASDGKRYTEKDFAVLARFAEVLAWGRNYHQFLVLDDLVTKGRFPSMAAALEHFFGEIPLPKKAAAELMKERGQDPSTSEAWHSGRSIGTPVGDRSKI